MEEWQGGTRIELPWAGFVASYWHGALF